jgi:O-antigen ligase
MVRRLTIWMLVALTFTVPFEAIVELSGIGTISKAVGFVVAGLWLLTMLGRGRIRTPLPVHLMMLLFVLWNAASVFWTVDVEVSVDRVFTFAQLFLLVLIVWDTLASRSDLWLLLHAYVFGAWVSVLGLILGYLAQGGTTATRRVTTGEFNESDIAVTLALGIPIAWYAALSPDADARHGVLRWVHLAYVPAACFAILLTGSRSAVIALVPGLVYMLATLFRSKVSGWVLFVFAVVAVLALRPLVPETTLTRLATTGSEVTSGDLNGRLEIWGEAYDAFRERPIEGVGSGAFRTAGTRKVGHNFLFRQLAEVGIVGLGLFVSMLILLWSAARRHPQGLAGMWMSVLATWLLVASFHNLEERKQTWLLFGLAVASAALYRRSAAGGARGEDRSARRPIQV